MKMTLRDWPPPFTLREHFAVHKGNNQEWGELVSDLGKQRIFRSPDSGLNLTDAKLPPQKIEITKQDKACNDPEMESLLQGVDKFAVAKEWFFLAHLAKRALTRLDAAARSGDGEALFRFARVAVDIGEGISQMSIANPKALQPVAARYTRWPLMRSTHPLNCDPDSILECLKLGSALPICLDKFSKWKPTDHAGAVAIQLFKFLDLQRENNICSFVLPNRKKERAQDVLPPFSPDSAREWWKFAECVLLKSYPRPQDVPELDRIADKSRRKYPSERKKSILEKIKKRFLHMAGVKTWQS